MPQQYLFITQWQVNAPLKTVWDTIYESEQWPQWWKGVLQVIETQKGDTNGIGSIREYKLRSPMLYTLSFKLLLTERIDYQLLKGNASGELAGTGAWHFEEHGNNTIVKCIWDVSTTLWWMNSFAFILKPLFSFNHKVVMDNGAKSLAQKLNTDVTIIS